MPIALTAVVVAVGGAVLSWRWLRSGGYRREDEDAPLPDHRWLLLAVPVLTGALAWAQRDEPWPAALAAMLAAPTGLVLVAVDADVHRLPNAITLPAVPAVLGLLLAAAGSADRWGDLVRAVIAMGAVGGAFVLVSLVLGSRGLGMGDAKLMLSLAPLLAWHGWWVLLLAVYGAFLVAGVVAIGLVLLRRATRTAHLAFGPYLIGTALLALLVRA